MLAFFAFSLPFDTRILSGRLLFGFKTGVQNCVFVTAIALRIFGGSSCVSLMWYGCLLIEFWPAGFAGAFF